MDFIQVPVASENVLNLFIALYRVGLAVFNQLTLGLNFEFLL
jgi:hypothetical protein